MPMISNQRICELCEQKKQLTRRNYHELRDGVFRYTCRICLGGGPKNQPNQKQSAPIVEGLQFGPDICEHPALRISTQPGEYPASAYCNACGRMLTRAARSAPWTYTRQALPYGQDVKETNVFSMEKLKEA